VQWDRAESHGKFKGAFTAQHSGKCDFLTYCKLIRAFWDRIQLLSPHIERRQTCTVSPTEATSRSVSVSTLMLLQVHKLTVGIILKCLD
jgi:hypothetical protein